MNKETSRFIQSCILLGLACYLIEIMINGKLAFYIHLRFTGLIFVAIIALLIMVFIGFRNIFTNEKSENHKPSGELIKNKKDNSLPGLMMFPALIALSGMNEMLIWLAFLILLATGWIRLKQKDNLDKDELAREENSTGTLLIVIIPFFLGLLVPSSSLTTTALQTREINFSSPSLQNEIFSPFSEIETPNMTVLDLVKLINYEEDLSTFIGKPAEFSGFIYKDQRLSAGQSMVGRFIITCCVADAYAVGVIVDGMEDNNFPDDTWVQVKGEIDVLEIEGRNHPLIHPSSIIEIIQPEQPYLYP
jgi:uncharacterized repeat protein (TIGR03943 family)